MQEYRRYESNRLKKEHFAKLHEKIQNKYEEMQRKIEKSRSIDSFPNLQEEFISENRLCRSNIDLRERNSELEYQTTTKHNVVIETIQTNDATEEVNFTELSMSEYESPVSPKFESELENVIENRFFNDNFSKNSTESLCDITKDIDEIQSIPVAVPRISIRNKIGSRIAAAKEKRRREEKEKKEVKKDVKEKKKDSRENLDKFILSNTTKQDIKVTKRVKMATVTIALIEVKGIENEPPDEKPRIMMCRFRLGAEKYKSKNVKCNESVSKWLELFNLSLYDDHLLEISIWDRDNFIGKNVIDLSQKEKEKTHKIKINMDGEMANVEMFILLTISGTAVVNSVFDLDDYQETQRKIDRIKKKFAWYRLRDDYTDVGCLSVIVYGAKGLSGNDCYCVLQLGNERLQTHTESKTNDPNWMKIFTFTITDITATLEVSVLDEKKLEEVGKITIPLLKINHTKRKWYALKDNTQRERAKGNNPRILLEMRVTWNLVKASIRVVNPKEVKYLQTEGKLDRHVFARNISRSKAVLAWVFDVFKVIKTCFEWDSKKWNTIALTIWLLLCYFFKVWMLPLMLLIPFIWYRPQKYYLISWKKYFNGESSEKIDPPDNSKNDKEEKSLRQRINSLQEMVQSVQNSIGKFASIGESIKNLCNFTVPFLSLLGIFFIIIISLVMYLVPVNYIFMLWGVHKYTRKILRPNRIPNNEILDLLSRVPDDETLLDFEELPLEEISDDDKI